jgi:hypothetical protein
MPKYKIVSSATERPYEVRFTAVPKFPLDTGDPILFFLDGVLQIGRWFARVAGFDCIVQSDRVIRIVKGIDNISIVGLIVLLEARQCWN